MELEWFLDKFVFYLCDTIGRDLGCCSGLVWLEESWYESHLEKDMLDWSAGCVDWKDRVWKLNEFQI